MNTSPSSPRATSFATVVLAATAAFALLLSGCGADDASAPSSATSTPPSSEASPSETGTSSASSPDAGEGSEAEPAAAHGFSATTLDGAAFDGASLAGKPSVLWFWAPWCPTCRAQADGVAALADEYDGEVAVVGVGGLDDAGAIADVAGGIPHVTHLVDDEGEVWRHFRVTEQSSYVVLDAAGDIVSEGYLDDAAIAEVVAGLAKKA